MSNASAALTAIITAVITATLTVVVIQKTGVFQAPIAKVVVPDVRNLDEEGASGVLRSANLVMLRGGSIASKEAKPGTVVRQSIAPGAELERGQTVLVTFAESVPQVPSVTGMSVDEARQRLQQEGYELIVGDPVFDDNVSEGSIITQIPEANKELPKGKTVIVKASGGKGQVELPDLKGQSTSVAREQLEKLGLQANVRWVSWAETTSGVVLKQEPPAGTKLARNTSVDLTINR